jgi:hypothetical protein
LSPVPLGRTVGHTQDKCLIPVIFHEGFTFRGSLGPTLVGYDQFAGYVDFVTEAFGQYTTYGPPRLQGGLSGSAADQSASTYPASKGLLPAMMEIRALRSS